MTTIWGDPIEVNGICPGWLTKDDVCDIHTSWWCCSHETKPHETSPRDWAWKNSSGTVNITKIRLPQSHPYYTVQKYNLEHGTSFVYWPGGDKAPGDYGDGNVLFADGFPRTGSRHARWSWKYEGKAGGDIIGYTKKEEQPTMKIDFSPPIWAYEKVDQLTYDGSSNFRDAFAKYVSENEPAPVSIDPDLLLAREVVHEIAVEHDWVGLDILSGERDKDDVYGIPQALAAIKAYKERNGL